GSCKIIVASIEAVLQPTMPPQQLKRETIYLNTGDSVDQKELVQKLVSIGYSRCEAVEGAGQFSVRGDIVDIFPVQSVSPVRMELWGDDIDTISVFDPQTQRRIQSIENFSIAPAKETLCDLKELSEKIRNYSETIKGKYSETAKEILLSEAEQLESGVILQQVEKYYPLVHEKPSTIFDYGFKTVIFNEFASVFENARNILTQYQEDYKIYLESGTLCRGLEGYYQEFSYIQELAEKCFCIYSGSFLQSGERVEYKKLLNIDSLQTAPWGGEMRQLTEDLISYCQQGYCVMLAAGSEKTLNIIQSDLQESGISCEIMKSDSIWKKSVVYLMTGSFSSGFEYPEIKTALITQARALRSGKRLKHKKRGEEIRNLSDIAVGDLVVHVLHGIGKFLGIRKLELEGITKDYITIQYSGNENLYVPVTQLDMVSKYIGPRDDTGVRLNKLSSPEWQKTRNNVKRAVKDMAKELTELYAKREKVKGFAFYPDDSVQHEFEERFPYIETDDQLQAIEEIKHDMQRERPMDRLLCGDVGFGKTEVALRAAMKCILSGKQCAILVPTTVLAMQHYQTAVRRFEQFPVNVVLLSRFRTAKQQKEALEQMKNGVADLIIGTHRIVQKDVKFHALGLAIVDEEQRFGVGH
ncbi:MAG: DEAD/DEAH box helicase, partial [Ruminococcus sp.]|nr:DEAD/DEAH box helicase [Ruminococcus sp.]